MSQRDKEQPPRFCPTCGAKIVPGIAHCPSCGHSLAKPEEIARLWGVDPKAGQPDDGTIIDLYPESEPSLQATTPFTQTRPFQPSDRRAESGGTGSADPWSSTGGTLSKRAAPPPSPTPPPPVPARASGGPHGCLLGCLALLIIGGVAALLAWGALRPFISERIEDEIATGLTTELRQIDSIPVSSSGRIALTEEQINRDLDRHEEQYEPIERASVEITEDAITITFEIFGVSSTFRGGLIVDDGRLTVVDPTMSGTGGRLIDADELSDVFEREVAELLRRENLRPTGVRLRDGSIAISTEPAG
ncbi:MAG: hypothetical protein IT336_03295 [Thermomicrobiales bacterium]|nr:hypothetical protein [Thermomicrobiales bacterium]